MVLALFATVAAYFLLARAATKNEVDNVDYTHINEIWNKVTARYRSSFWPQVDEDFGRAGTGNVKSTRAHIKQRDMLEHDLRMVNPKCREVLFDDAFARQYQNDLAQRYDVGPGATGWKDRRLDYWFYTGNTPRRGIPSRQRVNAFPDGIEPPEAPFRIWSRGEKRMSQGPDFSYNR